MLGVVPMAWKPENELERSTPGRSCNLHGDISSDTEVTEGCTQEPQSRAAKVSGRRSKEVLEQENQPGHSLGRDSSQACAEAPTFPFFSMGICVWESVFPCDILAGYPDP